MRELVLMDRTTFRKIREIDTYESIIWTIRYNAFGDFELYLPVDSSILHEVKLGMYIWAKDVERVMIVDEINIITDLEQGNRLLIKGKSLESILLYRVIQKPITIKDGRSLQAAIRTLINNALISTSGTHEDRTVPNFVFANSSDPAVTSLTMEERQFDGENLYDVICELCEGPQIGFKIVMTETAIDKYQFTFSLYKGKDRSYGQGSLPYVVFSPSYDNIGNSNYLESDAAQKTSVVVVGEWVGPPIEIVNPVGTDTKTKTTTTSVTSSKSNGLVTATPEYETTSTSTSESDSESTPVKTYKENKSIRRLMVNKAGGRKGLDRREIFLRSSLSASIHLEPGENNPYDNTPTPPAEFPEGREGHMTKSEFDAILRSEARALLEEEENSYIQTFEGDVLHEDAQFKYGRDFFLGDIAQFANEYGIWVQVLVSEVVFTNDNNGYHVIPTWIMKT